MTIIDKQKQLCTATTIIMIDLELKPYCDTYQQLLVEELYYIPAPHRLHYGMCSVIGRLTFDNYRYQLQNIKLSCFDERHALPTGAISVLILPNHDSELPLPNQYVEVFGEAVLVERGAIHNGLTAHTEPPMSSAILTEKLIEMQVKLNADNATMQREIDAMQTKYEPAIYADSFKVIDEAERVILCNLELRMIRLNKRASRSNAECEK